MNDILFEVLKCVMIVATLVITRYVVPLLRIKVEASKYSDIADWVIDAVKWAEQTIRESGKGAEKKEQVKDFLIQYAYEHCINITAEQLDVLIESAVKAMKEG